jgi:hypothetical protein
MTYSDFNARRAARGMAAGAEIDAGLRAYMQRVYNYMAGGLALTGIVAYAAAVSGFYQSIAGTPLIWVVMLAPLGFVFALSFGIQRMSAGTATLLFWIYAAVMGLSLGGIFLVYTGASIARVLHHRRDVRCDEPVWLYDRDRSVAVRLVPSDGPYRHRHCVTRQHLYRVKRASVRNLDHRRHRVRWPDRIRHATHQGHVS